MCIYNCVSGYPLTLKTKTKISLFYPSLQICHYFPLSLTHTHTHTPITVLKFTREMEYRCWIELCFKGIEQRKIESSSLHTGPTGSTWHPQGPIGEDVPGYRQRSAD